MTKQEKDKHNKLTLLVGMSAVALGAMQPSPVLAQNLSCPQPLIYGEMTVFCGGANTALVRPDGTRSVGGCLTTGGAPFSNASCNVSQTFPFQNMQISVPASATITRTAGVETMSVTAFNLVTNGNGASYTTSTAFITVPIGASLNPGASPVSGTYSGTFTVNAVFQ